MWSHRRRLQFQLDESSLCELTELLRLGHLKMRLGH
jgi:hypothetical protein